jgi:succinate dehydrogenase / fumarate reductase cytochrome b subunit
MHMMGNLLIYLGPEALNAYAESLEDLGGLLWVARFGLLGFVVAHITVAIQLKMHNEQARPIAYVTKNTIKATLASRTMMVSGILLLLFIIYHILHFTLNVTHPEFAELVDVQNHHDVYRMVVTGFQNLYVSLFYIMAMICLGLHLSHGASSCFQSLGLNTPKYARYTQKFGPILATLVVVGNSSIPLSVLLGIIR